MMTEKQQQRPITPPPELVREWIAEAPPQDYNCIAEQAAQWGADQELDACCEVLKSLPLLEGSGPLGIPFGEMASNALRAERRPEPPPRPTTTQENN